MLEDVFKTVPRLIPISIEIKDADDIDACMNVVALIKKYNRFPTTVLGGEENKVQERLLKIDSRICTFMSK